MSRIIPYNNCILRKWFFSDLVLFPNRFIFLLLSLLFLTPGLTGQGNTVITFGQEEGLCGQNYITSCIDSKGRLWVASPTGGVSCYNGSDWKCYFKRDGLLHSTSYYIESDKYGNVLVNHNEFGLTLIRDDSILRFKILNINPKAIEGFGIRIIKDELYIFNIRLKLLYRLGAKTLRFHKVKNNLHEQIKNPAYNGAFYTNSLDTIIAIKKDENNRIAELALFIKNNKNPIEYYKFKNPIAYNQFGTEINNLIIYTNNEILISIKGKIKSFYPKVLEYNGKSFDVKTDQLLTARSESDPDIITAIWSLEGSNREYLITDYDNNTGRIIRWFRYNSDYRPQSIIKDRAGTYWVLNESNVQRVLPYQFHIAPGSKNVQPQIWTAIQASNGNMWFASYRNGFSYFDGWKVYAPPTYLSNMYFYDGSITDQKGTMYFNREGSIDTSVTAGGILKLDGFRTWSISNQGTLGFMLENGKNGEILWGTASKGLWIKPPGKSLSDESWIKIDSSKGMYLTNVLCAVEDNYGRYWMGRSSQGISVYEKESKKAYNFFKEHNQEMFGLMSLAEDHIGNLWFGTDRGLYFFRNNKSINENFDIIKYSELIGIETIGNSLVNICKIYDKNTLLVGNMSGYYLLDLGAFYKTPRNIRFKGVFQKKNGNYPGGQVNQNSAFIDRDSLIWIPTSNGVFRHDPKLFLRDTSIVEVRVDSITTGDKKILRDNFGACVELSSSEKSLTIYFSHINNTFLYDNIWYRYRLNDNEWSDLTKLNSISYQNLENNTYVFQVQALKNGDFSGVYSVKFRIDSPWWQKWWFWLLIFGTISLTGLFLSMKQNVIKNQQIQIATNRAQVEIINREKSKLQIEAITNQLNPHFINNALQWLQVRIDKDEEAVGVVDKLSENISTVFKNSRNKINFHPLKEELRLTENYLFIQKARFGDRLQIKLPESDQVQILGNNNVPLMIIQIHTENAVEHGIRNKNDGRGTVSISIQDNDDYIKIIIEDDGVGRTAAQSIGSKGTQNGTKMLNELEKIYNDLNVLKMSQSYDDGVFSDPEGKMYGTRMNILIPKSFNFNV